jgi:hypothetical protein
MATFLLPQVGSKGLIKLDAPFTNLVTSDVPYTVAAVRRLSDIASSGIDPFVTYYSPLGIDLVKYQADIVAGVCILSLQSPSDSWVYVPNSYLLAMPDSSGIAYTNIVVGVNLGALPDGLALDYFNAKVRDLAHDLLGVSNADVRGMVNSATTYLSKADHDVIAAARRNVMGIVVTDAAKLKESERQLATARAKIVELENFIRALAA